MSIAKIKASATEERVLEIITEGNTDLAITLWARIGHRLALNMHREDNIPVSLAMAGLATLIQDSAQRIAIAETVRKENDDSYKQS